MNLIDEFHKLYYNSYVWKNTFWLGVPVQKCPLDLWIYQEIIYETKPDVIIECGTSAGGSALFLASICDMINHGEIITIDIEDAKNKLKHSRITYLIGYSISDKITKQI